LHVNVHALFTHAGRALGTLVEHVLPQVEQFFGSVAGFTHVLPQSVGVAGGHAPTQVEPEHTDVPPHAWLHVPQLLLSIAVLTHAPLQGVYPALHVNVHVLFTHAACAFATLVEQTFPHVLQSFGLLVVSTQVPPQRAGADAGHPETHEYVPPELAHTGVLPVQALPQEPQSDAVVSGTQAPLQSVYPVLQAKVHALLTHTAFAFAAPVVQTTPQVPQFFASLVVSTHALPLHSVGVAGGQAERQVNAPPELAHTSFAAHAFAQPPQLDAVE
jgi:hypothetical protein